ncbi:phosphomannomutase/phosphoglucomutase [Melissococcus plutonius]|nr:phosphoglucomutase [Melissococcus plutonius]MCV2499037.1 phosphomannomutase/phosphoglucomutase [Melissococcus plutonius]MCV2500235.1 phosphomannomutase/phosphoglucomutase [Melissococcus plutonius]MCV2504173.1 phosphomannomutase/phosphoglucomutase [Melissococcus plutonius]MCV2507590.1 phosphomannomutase/phosphoglucomutase [Melissococcus plutonius]MCV2519944.1 phosphomannomutase/phosphoglucomutase [Melissococcus plutonius]
MMYLDALQNGSDIRGIALDYQDKKANLTPKQLEKIAIGIVRWLENDVLASKCKRNQLKIGIGHDSRITADSLKQTLIDTFLHLGIQVIDFQLATTPAMFMATQFSQYNCDATIMITASHLPYYFNGLKIFTKKEGAEKKDIQYILTHHESLPGVKGGTILTTSLLDDYADDLIHKIKVGIHTQNEKPLAGYKIIVDAGNGAGGFFVEKVLKPLGANTEGSQFLDPDGMFPNHIPNPDNEEAMHSIQAAVLKQQADLGIIFDTDVDRSAIVDANGQVINRNNLIALLATIVLEGNPKSAIVTNSPTSSHLKEFIESKGGKQIRYISGYRNVINKMIELNNQGIQTELAIETSGHAAFKENYCLDDGAYVVAKLLMLLPKLAANHQTLGGLIATLKQPAEVHELRFQIKANDVQTYGNQIISDLEVFIQQQKDMVIDPENEEGIRTNVFNQYGNGWFLLRMSLHEPLLVLQIENDKQTKNRHVLKTLEPFFQQFYQLDDKALKNYLHQK